MQCFCGFAICGQKHIKKIRIFNGGMSPTICGFAYFIKKVCLPPLTSKHTMRRYTYLYVCAYKLNMCICSNCAYVMLFYTWEWGDACAQSRTQARSISFRKAFLEKTKTSSVLATLTGSSQLRAQRQDPSISAHALSKLILVIFHPIEQSKRDVFITRIWNIFTISMVLLRNVKLCTVSIAY